MLGRKRFTPHTDLVIFSFMGSRVWWKNMNAIPMEKSRKLAYLPQIYQINYPTSLKYLLQKLCKLFKNNLIFFMFIRFPAILLVKTLDSYLHELCTGYFT